MSRSVPPQAAGKMLVPKPFDNTASCLVHESRPVTPEEVRRYRKSYFAEPGARIAHPGLIPDLKQRDLWQKFGVSTRGSHHVPDVLPNTPISEYQRIQQMKTEANYASHRREPLGKSYTRGHVLPSHMQQPDFVFGISGTFGESAKELLYPSTNQNNREDEELYKRSHGSLAPGEQRNRQYQWGKAQVDPKKHRFGVKTITPGMEGRGVSTCLNPEMDESVPKTVVTVKQVEDKRGNHDHLGRPRHLPASAKVADDHVFGVGRKRDEVTAWDCIQGQYSVQEQQPDADLSRAANHSWINSSAETRAFGVPTVRADIPVPAHRSIADGQNYGDDVSSKELLYPEEFASSGIKDEEFAVPQSEQDIRALFAQIGYQLSDATFALIWKDATASGQHTSKGMASIIEFRNALNAFLEAEDNGSAARDAWRSRIEKL